MTRVALVASQDLVRVTPQSEHAIPASFKTWTEAVAYCKSKKYTIFNEVEAESNCRKELEGIEADVARLKENNEALAETERMEAEAQGGEGSDA